MKISEIIVYVMIAVLTVASLYQNEKIIQLRYSVAVLKSNIKEIKVKDAKSYKLLINTYIIAVENGLNIDKIGENNE